MPQLSFYALKTDIELVLEFVFASTDCRVFESYSRTGYGLREFHSLSDLRHSDVRVSNGCGYSLRLISRSIGCDPVIREYVIEKTRHTRQSIGGPGLYHILEGERLDAQEGALHWSKFAYYSEAATKDIFGDEKAQSVDWKRMRRISGQIQRHIKKKLAVAVVGSRPILPDAFRALDDSLLLWAGPGLVNKGSDGLTVYGD